MRQQRKNTSIQIRIAEKTQIQRMKSASLYTFPQALFGSIANVSSGKVFEQLRRTASMPVKFRQSKQESKPMPRISQGMPLAPLLPVKDWSQKLFLAASRPKIRICEDVLKREKTLIRQFKKSLQEKLTQPSVYEHMVQNRRSTIRRSTLFDHRSLLTLQNEYSRFHAQAQGKISQDNSKIVSQIEEEQDVPQSAFIAKYIKTLLVLIQFSLKSTKLYKIRAEAVLLREKSIQFIQGIRVNILNYEITRIEGEYLSLMVHVSFGGQRMHKVIGNLTLKSCNRTDLCFFDQKIRNSVKQNLINYLDNKSAFTVCKHLSQYYIKKGIRKIKEDPIRQLESIIPEEITVIGLQQVPTYMQPKQHTLLASLCRIHEQPFLLKVCRQKKQVYVVLQKNNKIVQRIKWKEHSWSVDRIQQHIETQTYIDRQIYWRFMPLDHQHRRINGTLISKNIVKIKKNYWLSWLYDDDSVVTAVVRRMGRRDGYWIRLPSRIHNFSYVYSNNQLYLKYDGAFYEMQYFLQLKLSLKPAIIAVTRQGTVDCQMRHKYSMTLNKQQKYYHYDDHQLYQVSRDGDCYVVQNSKNKDQLFRIQQSRLSVFGLPFPSKNRHRLWKMLRQIIKQDAY